MHGALQDDRSEARTSKVRHAGLPQEYELERFVKDIEPPHSTWKSDVPACHWHGVTCNDKEKVTDICWGSENLSGKLQWASAPCTLLVLHVFYNSLHGPLDFKLLPRGMTFLNAPGNKMSGGLDFTVLPTSMLVIDLQGNVFTGEVDLSNLPPNLRFLHLGFNTSLYGVVQMAQLPKSLALFTKETKIIKT